MAEELSRTPIVCKLRKPIISSGVPFYPPHETLWRIGERWYDFTPFLSRHPGGEEVMRLARDRFEDATYAFESHHHNYMRARAVIAKYEVPAPREVMRRPGAPSETPLRDGYMLGADQVPKLLDDDAFYSVCRRRLTEHLRSVGCPGGGPTNECLVWFWTTFVGFCVSWLGMYATGAFSAALAFGMTASLLGAFGHNWVRRWHEPFPILQLRYPGHGWPEKVVHFLRVAGAPPRPPSHTARDLGAPTSVPDMVLPLARHNRLLEHWLVS